MIDKKKVKVSQPYRSVENDPTVYTSFTKYTNLGSPASPKDSVIAFDANFNWEIYKTILEFKDEILP